MDQFPDGFKRRFSWNAVDFNSGKVVTFDETTPADQLATALQSSTAMPFAFPHTYMDDKVLVDGGSVWNVDFPTAINRCREIVGD